MANHRIFFQGKQNKLWLFCFIIIRGSLLVILVCSHMEHELSKRAWGEQEYERKEGELGQKASSLETGKLHSKAVEQGPLPWGQSFKCIHQLGLWELVPLAWEEYGMKDTYLYTPAVFSLYILVQSPSLQSWIAVLGFSFNLCKTPQFATARLFVCRDQHRF